MKKDKKSKPVPIPPFQSIQHAVDRLIGYSHKLPESPHDKYSIVDATVGGNIFRAFRGIEKPSIIYRQWAEPQLRHIHDQLQNVKSQKDYDTIILDNSFGLIDWWDSKYENKNHRIGFGPASKMVNLLVKTIQQRKTERIEGLEKFMHVPFDLFTLTPLRFIVNELVEVRYNIPIPTTSTMKFVVNEELYKVLQTAVRNLSTQANCDPIIYEYMCFDNQH